MDSNYPGFRSALVGADLLRVAAVLTVAICLVPEGAHLFEMFSKLGLPPGQYMTVQKIYDGWALFGVVIVLALLSTLGLAIAAWRRRVARYFSLASFAAVLGTQVIFWYFIYPMNALTRNWTKMPDDLEVVRRQWEYGHAVNAVLALLALIMIVAAVLADIRSGTQAQLNVDSVTEKSPP